MASSRFYSLIASSTDDVEAKQFLEGMAALENKHAATIEESSKAVLGGHPLEDNADSDVDMIETMPAWKYADGVNFADAMQIAYDAENQAALYYDALSDCFEGEMRVFFRDLARTEEEHAESLARMRNRVKPHRV